jgi:dTMP kinase
MSKAMLGKLIVFEGVEGSGKTTQIEHTYQWLIDSGWQSRLQAKGCKQIITTREPGGTELGLALRQLLLGQSIQEAIQDRAELLLYAADRAQHVEGFLKPLLAAGALILCDRYTDSTTAYQGYGRGLNQTLIAQLNQIATNGLESDLTLWLNLDVEVGLQRTHQRGSADRIEQANLLFHQNVQQGFSDLARLHPQRIIPIDASLSETAVAQQIQATLNHQLTKWYGVDH